MSTRTTRCYGAHSAIALALLAAMAALPAVAKDAPVWNPTDGEINLKIQGLLVRDNNVDANNVEVITRDGEVTLAGVVANSFARDHIARVVADVKGVRRVVNRLDVSGTPKTDEKLVEDLTWLLQNDPATAGLDITVHASDGQVTLSGTAASRQEKDLARLIAVGAYGVRSIENNIEVRPETRTADVTAEEIRRRLRTHDDIDASNIVVEVEEGRVTLAGAVGSVFERNMAEQLAWVRGVQDVDAAGLVVSPEFVRVYAADPRPADEMLAQDIALAYYYDPRVSPFDIVVDVRDGVATLTGVVDNLRAKDSAERLAQNVRGVHRVRNLLQVRGPEVIAHEGLQQNIERHFAIDPVLGAEDIEVTVVGNKATLRGHVNTPFKRDRAVNLVARQRGITHVENRITVADWTWKPDSEIQADIRDELRWNPFVLARRLDVAVEDGVATITGEVDAWEEHDAVVETAYRGGARRVISELSVAPAAQEQATYYGPTYDRFRSPRRQY
jgi:osmotically-inducible protein OsmY